MLDALFQLGQVLSVFALAWGAILTIRGRASADEAYRRPQRIHDINLLGTDDTLVGSVSARKTETEHQCATPTESETGMQRLRRPFTTNR
jgi:hypothetical protein